ncbi:MULTISPECIES: ABC-F family ATP-binding cassette domain-containing protein [Acetobacter]|uniref:ABC-F family ATP-binding cassette domain-containing protein n=1 Tax=Acetobacter thailandicus TaxID=1502842 RepID=A0ABT3QG41_9PROT|nr:MULTISPECIES: ABC-F family ATP-binding cassette domain-containing protein [Acetobacter]MBS1002834.1 ABC-F family ATP-binding cassette domain-containing protein [Acetobacter thailandicus]MCX2564253.1 ABC-F family ATP-binding cassette domain-containing protein [Acetobacter thailandicus]NHN95597.1 ATP-binding cassette domain-containing protein [Acetobacter thailandicus]OUI85601.1 elongation factor 3 [Acetobacter sp. DmW_043]
MGPAPILHLQDISFTLGGRPLLNGANLAVTPGERICLIGRNGSGKSTLLKIAASQLLPDSGSVFLQPGATLQYLPQEPDLSGHKTALDYVQSRISDPTDLWRAAALLDAVNLSGDKETAHLSGGEVRRCAIAGVLAASPDILLLDEPTNHLDLPTIGWLEKELMSLNCAIVIISHDHRLLSTLSRSVVWLDRGETRRLDQGFDRFEEWREEFLEQESRDAHKLDRQIEREEDWMRYGVTARRKRNVRRVAELADLRKKRSEAIKVPGKLTLDTLSAGTSSKLVAVAENISKSWGDRTIVNNLDLRILRGDRLAIIGANGAGKTTLLRMLIGEDQPDSGTIVLGPSLSMASLDQKREMLDPEKTLSDTLTGGGEMIQVGSEKRHVIGYMKEFLFRPEQARTPVSALSGGERGRLMLACILSQPSNFLVLDEPTNDLDLETLDLLQDMLASYPGTVLLISHDRDFIDRVATSVLTTEGDGNWTEYVGGYSSMLSQMRASSQPASSAPAAATLPQTSAAAPKQAAKKLNYKDQFRLSQLPQEMAKLEQKKEALKNKLDDVDLYARNPTQFQKYSADLEAVETLLSGIEEEWLALELKKEELENN